MSIPAIRRNGWQFQYLDIVINNKTGPLFLEHNLCEKSFRFSKQPSKQRDITPLNNEDVDAPFASGKKNNGNLIFCLFR